MSAYLKTICNDLYRVAAFSIKEDCYEQGQASSSQGFPRNANPYPVCTDLREWWDGGYLNEADELTGENAV